MIVEELNLNYTGLFFEDGTHMTFKYGMPKEYPPNVNPGDRDFVTVIGKYEDEQVSCWVVKYKNYTHQSNGTLLHITTKVQNGGKPAMSGQRATKLGYVPVSEFKIFGEWK